MNGRDEEGNLSVCIPSQVLMEFVNVITHQNLKSPLSLSEAIKVIQDYLESNILIINQRETQIQTFIELLSSVTLFTNFPLDFQNHFLYFSDKLKIS